MAKQLDIFGAQAKPVARGKAVWSPDHRYRYLLTWPVPCASPSGRTAMMVGLNPSIASEYELDPTLRRFSGFAEREGCSRMVIANVFALVSTDPLGLLDVEDPVGPDNDRHIAEAAAEASLIICAWGANEMAEVRAPEVLKLLQGKPLWCLGTNMNGSPKHPLYLAANTPLIPFTPKVCR